PPRSRTRGPFVVRTAAPDSPLPFRRPTLLSCFLFAPPLPIVCISAVVSCCAGSFEHRRDRQRQNFQIEPKRPAVDVLQIQHHPLFEGNRVPPVHLPQTGNSRRYAESPSVPVLIEKLIITDGYCPRTDKAHVALEHIVELWQFVDTRPAQNAPDGCDSRIILDLEHRAGHFI